MTRAARLNVFGFMTTNISGKAHEGFLILLLASDPDLFGVNHDDKVAGIDVWSEKGLLFSAQKVCCFDRDMTEHLIFGIDQPPFAINLTGFGGKRLHRRSEKGTETTGRD